jgi:dienelactone hydrolase
MSTKVLVMFRLLLLFLIKATACFVTNAAERDVRPIPAPGVAIPDLERVALADGASRLRHQLDVLRGEFKSRPAMARLLSDVEIFEKAARYALGHNEIYNITNELPAAHALLKMGFERVQQLRDGQAPWLSATGLVVRGYVSRIDGSVQPYGLVVPPSFSPANPQAHRLDIWFHGRDEKLTELNFLAQRTRSFGEFAPANTIVLHPYGRYCNANKFAGETDLFEALAHVREQYNIDENRIAVRGFSMGGAACWQFAVHYADLWAAAAPGAGFAESAQFLNLSPSELRPWYQTNLWHLYDCTGYAANLLNCPVVAYSGEIDKQKQAADMMAAALAEEGIELAHVIGPQTAHKYHPAAKDEINRRIDNIMNRGRNPVPPKVRFTTWTLRYNRMHWVTVDALHEHWARARVEAQWDKAGNVIRATTTNVAALTIEFPSGLYPLEIAQPPVVVIDGQELLAPRPLSDRSFKARFARKETKWTVAQPQTATTSLVKKHGLQGPIDDAFMDSFLIVRPTGSAVNDEVQRWVNGELTRATNEWRRQFRGDVRIKADTEITDSDIAEHNLVLWGDPSSNQLLGKIAGQLPIQWERDAVKVGAREFASAQHVPALIYPNPLNPRRYVVLNSGMTFREADYLSNARQVPKLPDYAVIDITKAPDGYAPGNVVEAGFFDEHWKLK